MKDYHVVTAHPALTPKIKKMGPAAGEAFRRATHRQNLLALAKKIKKIVLKNHGGEIVYNGSDYGRPGAAREFVDTLTIRTSPAGVEALKNVPGVNQISESIDFDHLLKVPDFCTNVPHGLCWQRPGL